MAHTEQEIQAKARRLGYVAAECPYCGGKRFRTDDDMNSPGGKITRPCNECGPNGRVWYRSDLAPRPGVRTPISSPLSDAKLMELPEP